MKLGLFAAQADGGIRAGHGAWVPRASGISEDIR